MTKPVKGTLWKCQFECALDTQGFSGLLDTNHTASSARVLTAQALAKHQQAMTQILANAPPAFKHLLQAPPPTHVIQVPANAPAATIQAATQVLERFLGAFAEPGDFLLCVSDVRKPAKGQPGEVEVLHVGTGTVHTIPFQRLRDNFKRAEATE